MLGAASREWRLQFSSIPLCKPDSCVQSITLIFLFQVMKRNWTTEGNALVYSTSATSSKTEWLSWSYWLLDFDIVWHNSQLLFKLPGSKVFVYASPFMPIRFLSFQCNALWLVYTSSYRNKCVTTGSQKEGRCTQINNWSLLNIVRIITMRCGCLSQWCVWVCECSDQCVVHVISAIQK